MATGDVSKLLVSQLRDELKDQEKILIPVDNILYDKLTYYQLLIMTKFYTNAAGADYPLVNGTSEYSIPENWLSIYKITFNEDISYIPRYKIDWLTRAITLSDPDNFVTGTDVMTVKAYTKPLVTDKIYALRDPIITADYYYLLRKCVLSEYLSVNQTFEPLSVVLEQIRQLSETLKALNRAETIKLFQGVRF